MYSVVVRVSAHSGYAARFSVLEHFCQNDDRAGVHAVVAFYHGLPVFVCLHLRIPVKCAAAIVFLSGTLWYLVVDWRVEVQWPGIALYVGAAGSPRGGHGFLHEARVCDVVFRLQIEQGIFSQFGHVNVPVYVVEETAGTAVGSGVFSV